MHEYKNTNIKYKKYILLLGLKLGLTQNNVRSDLHAKQAEHRLDMTQVMFRGVNLTRMVTRDVIWLEIDHSVNCFHLYFDNCDGNGNRSALVNSNLLKIDTLIENTGVFSRPITI